MRAAPNYFRQVIAAVIIITAVQGLLGSKASRRIVREIIHKIMRISYFIMSLRESYKPLFCEVLFKKFCIL